MTEHNENAEKTPEGAFAVSASMAAPQAPYSVSRLTFPAWEKRRTGEGSGRRPIAFDPEAAMEIIRRVMDGHLLKEIEADPEMPTRHTIYKWREEVDSFSEAFDRARAWQAESLVEEGVQAARDAKDKDSAAAGRVKTETFLKVAARLDPEKWAEKRDMTGAGVKIILNTSLPAPEREGDPAKPKPLTVELRAADMQSEGNDADGEA